jgi:hypothetical protein
MIRLLKVTTKEFEEFNNLGSVPYYAILSHRWNHEQGELSYKEFLEGKRDGPKYEKIGQACDAVQHLSQTLKVELHWIWIDSCCINKTDSDEYTEAINSMYEWYARSYVCIAYLKNTDPLNSADPDEWFARGWTLQELIAPERVLFYNNDWIGCGSRNDYNPGLGGGHSFQNRSKEIAAITKIEASLLNLEKRKDIKRRLDSIPACQKMSWASDRKTTNDEDMAYCLIGIFDIPHMYLKRGEGRRAFIRLQEEIIKQSNDLTLFAWKLSGDDANTCMENNCLILNDLRPGVLENAPFFDSSPNSDLHGVFACGPCHFRHAFQIEPTQLAVYNDEIAITSRGVKLSTPLLGSGPFLPFRMPLYCTEKDTLGVLSIELRLLGGSIYGRTHCTQLPPLLADAKVIPSQDDVFLAHNVHRFQNCAGEMHKHAIQLPESIGDDLERGYVSPGYLWSSKHNLVITNGRRFFVGCAGYHTKNQHNSREPTVTLLFGLDHLQKPWFCLSNVDQGFNQGTLENRKMYLERVWRLASQHHKTAHLDNKKKTFHIEYNVKGYTQAIVQGTMCAVRETYQHQDIFKANFIPEESPTKSKRIITSQPKGSAHRSTLSDRREPEHSIGITPNLRDRSHSPRGKGHNSSEGNDDFPYGRKNRVSSVREDSV